MSDVERLPGELTGRCLCGSVVLQTSGVEARYNVCHCDMCRRWNGTSTLSVTATQAHFDGEEHITEYQSSDWATRAFCNKCGSHLYYRFAQSTDWFLWAGLFDDQSRFTMGQEIYTDAKPPGYAFAGDHPRLTEEEFLKSIGMWNDAAQ